MSNLQKFGGIAAIMEATIYISAFVFFGAIWEFPATASLTEKLAFLKENQAVLAIVNLTMYVVFGILLTVLVMALHERLKVKTAVLSQAASIFGLIWVGLVIASGMIANIGLGTVIELSAKEPELARTVWLVTDSVVEGIGGGNEIVGGLWVLLLSCAALKGQVFSKKLNYLGLGVGLAGVSTVYPADVLTELFGISQVIWFLWLGIAMLTGLKVQKQVIAERELVKSAQ